MTINKAQEQSLVGIGVHLGSEVFSHGQLYVALSRAKRRERVKVYSPGAHSKRTNQEIVKNMIKNSAMLRYSNKPQLLSL
ncbi:hypothetical protein ANCCAN_24522 [Ancylostoma caninum]|uniref:Uncharacterized protein n=1 Tax=Ancylostoma caninum TaxID=29170 RepID=A0A368FC67_ANCCA|nr:hypothetical protein ANCCAN_24522 [Ancylostoma caninum]